MKLSRGGTFSAPFVVTSGNTEHSQKSLDLGFSSFILVFGLFPYSDLRYFKTYKAVLLKLKWVKIESGILPACCFTPNSVSSLPHSSHVSCSWFYRDFTEHCSVRLCFIGEEMGGSGLLDSSQVI